MILTLRDTVLRGLGGKECWRLHLLFFSSRVVDELEITDVIYTFLGSISTVAFRKESSKKRECLESLYSTIHNYERPIKLK